MSIKTGTAVGAYISAHIKDTEWACRRSSSIKYDTTELEMLERLRSDFGASALIIESGYRTVAYNAEIGGASGSPHTKGYAADIRLIKDGKLVPTEVVCCHAQDMGFKGVAICRGSGINTHLDMLPTRTYRGDERKGNYGNNIAGNDWYKETGLSKADVQKYLAEKTEEEDMTEDQVREIVRQELNGAGKDQLPSDWAVTELQEAKDAGITDGIDPDSYVTREQAAVMSVRAAKSIGVKTK